MQESFSPRQLFLEKLRLWWIPLLFACIGALIGILLSMIIPAQYEAKAEINLAVDFSKTGIITDIEQDQIIEMVGDICKSSLVINAVDEQVPEISVAEFNNIASLKRRNTQWVLLVRHTNPQLAEDIARQWQQIAYEEIIKAYEHAIVVDTLSDMLNKLTSCFEQAVPQAIGDTPCTLLSVSDLQIEIAEIAEQIKVEQELSQGISPAISLSTSYTEKLPVDLVTGFKFWFIIAGGGIGFLLGIWGIVLLKQRKAKQ
ncbi:MAG: hypothetical protein JEZ00_01590 [Anaerolineaceae bacterium]|nr:hypothetical protein [Anaerolineaceae bacterium]